MKRTAKAVWKGAGASGSGTLNTQSGVFDEQPYSIQTRYENEDDKLSENFDEQHYSHKTRVENEDWKLGTNPEELIAAAHAGCFAMALSVELEGAGYTADTLEASAKVHMDKEGDGWAINKVELTLDARVPDI